MCVLISFLVHQGASAVLAIFFLPSWAEVTSWVASVEGTYNSHFPPLLDFKCSTKSVGLLTYHRDNGTKISVAIRIRNIVFAKIG